MRISKKTRADAVLMLEIVGNNTAIGWDDRHGDGWIAVWDTIAPLAGRADELTNRALAAANSLVTFGSNALEAAALLRDGWSPGDPVRLLRNR